MLAELHKKDNKTIIMVTHDPSLLKYTERTLKILDGKIVLMENKVKLVLKNYYTKMFERSDLNEYEFYNTFFVCSNLCEWFCTW
jgi:ABC-type lipoprotein export system ATPase subunit